MACTPFSRMFYFAEAAYNSSGTIAPFPFLPVGIAPEGEQLLAPCPGSKKFSPTKSPMGSGERWRADSPAAADFVKGWYCCSGICVSPLHKGCGGRRGEREICHSA